MAKEPSTHHHPSPRMGGRGVPPKPSLELASACEEASGPLRILHRTEGPSLLGGGWAPRQPRSAKLKPDRNRTPSGTAGFQAHETRHTAQDTCPPAKRSCLWGERVHFPNQKEHRGPEDHSPSEELRSQGGRAGLGAGWPQHCSGVQPARRGGSLGELEQEPGHLRSGKSGWGWASCGQAGVMSGVQGPGLARGHLLCPTLLG